MDCSLPGCSVHGIIRERILEWVTIFFSRGSSWPRDWTCVSCIGRKIIYCWATKEAQDIKSQPWLYEVGHIWPLSTSAAPVLSSEPNVHQVCSQPKCCSCYTWAIPLSLPLPSIQPSPLHESKKWKWCRSAVSDSSRPHGLQPTRLLRPWDFQGKSTGVGCHSLLCLFCFKPKQIVWFSNYKFWFQEILPFHCKLMHPTTLHLSFSCNWVPGP